MMRINFRYGAAAGILAAAFGMLGPMASQAGQTPGTSVPVPTGARAVSVQAPATHLLAITGKSVVLSSAFERPAWQHGIGIAQRQDTTVGNGQEQFGLPAQQDRMLIQSNRCGGHYGYDHGCCYGGGYGYGHGCCYGGGYGGGYGHGCCYGGGYGGGYGHGCCYGGGYGGGYGYDHGGYGYDHGGCCYGGGYGHGYDHGRCVSHYSA